LDETGGIVEVKIDSNGHLLGHLLRFGRMLRLMGVNVSLGQMIDLVEATRFTPITEQLDFYCASRALLVNCREDLPVFDQAFEIFWLSLQQTQTDQKMSGSGKQARLPGEGEGDLPDRDEGGCVERGSSEVAGEQAFAIQITRYSPIEILRQKDFREMSWEEIQAAKRAMGKLKWKLGERRTRRYRASHKGRLDLRRVIRNSLAKGGDPIILAFRKHAYHPRPLVVLCDVSGSMERYSRLLLHFIHTLTHGLTGVDVEAFVFGTRLTRITHHLRHRDIDESIDQVGKTVLDWSGGTRIGEAIKAFNFQWARRVVGRGAVILIISDGWDRGDVSMLAYEVARLQRLASRLMWLNPLAGSGEQQHGNLTRGMAAVQAYVDDFLPGNNLASLEQLAEILSDVRLQRPARKQHPHWSQKEQAVPPEIMKMEEHPFIKVVAEYPWLKMFNDLGDKSKGAR
jgi:uncharacterized protein